MKIKKLIKNMYGIGQSRIKIDPAYVTKLTCNREKIRKAVAEGFIVLLKAKSSPNCNSFSTSKTDKEKRMVRVRLLRQLWRSSKARMTPVGKKQVYKAIRRGAIKTKKQLLNKVKVYEVSTA